MKLFIPLFFLFIFLGHTVIGQDEFKSEVVVTGKVFSVKEYEAINKNHFSPLSSVGLDSLVKDSISVIFSPDDTFEYRLTLHIHHKNETVSLVAIPLKNSQDKDVIEDIKQSIRFYKDNYWTLSFDAHWDPFSGRSVVARPLSKDYKFTYTMSSVNKGETWQIYRSSEYIKPKAKK